MAALWVRDRGVDAWRAILANRAADAVAAVLRDNLHGLEIDSLPTEQE